MLGTGHDEVCLCPTADPLATQTPCTRFGSSSACANRPPAPLDVDDGLTCMAFARLLRTCSKSSTSADMLREYQVSLARFLALCTFLQTVGVTLGTRSSLRLAAQRRRRIHVAATSATETYSCASFSRGHPLARGGPVRDEHRVAFGAMEVVGCMKQTGIGAYCYVGGLRRPTSAHARDGPPERAIEGRCSGL